MKEMISFPNIGITFERIGTGISIFGFEITFFGILLGAALLVGIGLTLWEAYNTRQNMDEYLNISIVTVLASIVGARMFYVLFAWNQYKDNLSDVFLIRKGGMSFWGALLAGVIVIIIYANIKKISEGRILDTGCIGLAVGQCLCVMGDFFGREGFGDYTDGIFAMQVSLDTISVQAVTENMRKHIEIIGGERFVQVEPLFILKLVWSIIVIAIVLLYKYRKKFEGELFLVYLFVYSFGTFWIESARVDVLRIPIIGWNVCRVLTVIMMLLSAMIIIYMWTQNDKARMRRVREREAKRFTKKSRKKLYFS